MVSLKLFRLFLIHYLFFLVSTQDNNLPCLFHQSENISNAIDHLNGSYSHHGYMFDIGTYGLTDKIYLFDGTTISVENHLRGCICNVKGAKPCLPFCCPVGQIQVDYENTTRCEDNYLEHTITVKDDENKTIKVNDSFRMIQGAFCECGYYANSWEILVSVDQFNCPLEKISHEIFLGQWQYKFRK